MSCSGFILGDLNNSYTLISFYDVTERRNSGLFVLYMSKVPHISDLQRPKQVPYFFDSVTQLMPFFQTETDFACLILPDLCFICLIVFLRQTRLWVGF